MGIWENSQNMEESSSSSLKNPSKTQVEESYRPISITSHLGTILETIINTRIVYNLEKNELYSPTQSGFKSKSNMDQIIKLENSVKKGFKQGKKTIAVFLDISWAYDQCWKEAALVKFLRLGITRRNLRYAQNFLEERTASVRIGRVPNIFSRKWNIPGCSNFLHNIFQLLSVIWKRK